jgi:hypothetical protein
MEPQMAQAFERVYKADPYGNTWLKKFNDIAISSIFLNPVPHSLNEAYHWIVGRGEDWLKPSGWNNLFKTGARAITAVLSKNQDYVDALNSRAPLVQAGRARQDAIFNIAKLTGADIQKAPHEWDFLAKLGFRQPGDLVRYMYNVSGSAMWNVGDIMRLQRMYELQEQGMTKDSALREMVRHQPDYRLPLTVMGSQHFADFLANNRYALMFTRYHYKVFSSLADMVKNTANFKDPEEQRKAFGHLFMLGVTALVMKPALDKLAQQFTGNKDAEVRPRGPLKPIYDVADIARGKADLGKLVSGGFTLAPPARLAIDAATNRNWAGKQIINPQAPWYDQVGAAAEHLAGSTVAPYGQMRGTMMAKGSKGSPFEELRNQVLDIKAPTARQKAGQKFGQQIAKGEAQRSVNKPAGPIAAGFHKLGQTARTLTGG